MNQKSKKNYVLVTIHTDGRVTKIIQAKEPSLEQLQEMVGGYIESIPYFTQLAMQGEDDKVFAYSQGQCWANEEGKLPHLNLPANIPATQAWNGQFPSYQVLVGDVVFVARTQEELPAGAA